MNICDIRDERLLADDDMVEPPDAQEIVTSPGPLGIWVKSARSPIKYIELTIQPPQEPEEISLTQRSVVLLLTECQIDDVERLLQGDISQLGRASDILQLNSELEPIVHCLIGRFSNSDFEPSRLPHTACFAFHFARVILAPRLAE